MILFLMVFFCAGGNFTIGMPYLSRGVILYVYMIYIILYQVRVRVVSVVYYRYVVIE